MRRKFTILLVALVVTTATLAAHAQVMTDVERLYPNAASWAALVRVAPGPLADGVEAYADRIHVYRNVPAALVGAEYVLMSNEDKYNPDHELHITIGQAGTLYLIIDNRVGTHLQDEAVSPDLEAAGMTWVGEMGFIDTGMKMAVDESADGTLDNYYTVFSKPVSPGVMVLRAQNDMYLGGPYDRNMYGVAAVADDKTGDPSLVGWWKLDGEDSGAALDSSGWKHHGALCGGPRWVPGYIGGALQVDGRDDYVETNWAQDLTQWTVCAWVTSPMAPVGGAESGPVHRQANYQLNWNHPDASFRGAAATCIGDTWYPASFGQLSANTWHHLAATFDGTTLKAYRNGVLVTANSTAQGVPAPEPTTLKFGRHSAAPLFFAGAIDDVRVYNRGLTPEEIEHMVTPQPLQAWNPQPAQGANVAIEHALALNWSAGDTAVAHDLYLGTDEDLVEAADPNSPLYWGRQTDTSFSLDGLTEPGGRYFWRVDEVEADGTTIHQGAVWTFTVSDSLVIDDFESYTWNAGSLLSETWFDGLFNHTGSQMGLLGRSPAQPTGEHGRQSMSLAYDNARPPFVSEVEREFTPEQDWTSGARDTLSLWFWGDVVSFGETAPGIFTMSATGADIWSAGDQFRYAYMRLDGDGSIVARVESVGRTDLWAKAGVMIRESLDPAAAYAFMLVTPDGLRAFQNRPANNSACRSAHSWAAMRIPSWLKLERKGNQFTAYHSVDGINWIQQSDTENTGPDPSPNPQTVPMPAYVYVGLALTSHAAGAVTTATFSGVEITGDVIGQWQIADIGVAHPGNSPDDLYVAVEDGDGNTAVVVNPEPTAVNAAAWTEWKIPLSSFLGVDLSRVGRMCIGVGGRETSIPVGDGRIYIDDIRVRKP